MITLILVAWDRETQQLILGLFLVLPRKSLSGSGWEREAEVRAALPGSNCGAWFRDVAGCGMAVQKQLLTSPGNQCPVQESPAHIMADSHHGNGSVSVDVKRSHLHFMHRQGDCDKAKQQAHYSGIADCNDLWWFRAERKRLVLTSCCVATAPVSRFAPLMPFMWLTALR